MTTTRTRRTLILTIALSLAAVVAVLGTLSVQLKVASFQPTGVEAVDRGGILGVVQAAPGTGLEQGDLIVGVGAEETTPGQLDELRNLLRSAASTPVQVQRGEEIVQVRYQRPALRIDFPYMVLALIGIAYLLIGLYTLLRDTRRRTGLFFLWCLVSAAFFWITPGVLSATPGGTEQALFLADQIARLLLPALTLHLFLVFPTTLGSNRSGEASGVARLSRWLPFLYLPAAVQMLLYGDLFFAGGRLFFGGDLSGAFARLDRLETLSWVLFSLAAAAALLWRLRRETGWEKSRQVRWIALGIVGGYVPFALLYGAPRWLGFGGGESQLLNTAAVAPLALVPITFAWAILRYKLWDIDVIVRNAISATLTLMFGALGFALANLAISRGLPEGMATARNLASFATGLTIAGLMLPARRGIALGLERLQYRQSWGKRKALTEHAHELLHERDLGQLCANLLARLEDAIELERVNLYLDRGESLALLRAEAGAPPELPANALGEELWSREVESLSGVALPGGDQPVAQRLYQAGYRYVFPLTVSGQRVGLAVAGYRTDQRPLNSDDLDLIRQLLDQTALAIENAHLIERVQEQLAEVSALQSYTEGIVESSPAGIVVLDGERIVSANGAFAAMVGRDRDLLRDVPIAEVVPVRPLPTPADGQIEVSYCEADGTERHLRLSTAEFRTGEAAPVDEEALTGEAEPLVILMVHDVSERVALEAALRDKDRLAALGALAAGVAHEVNTPITGISSYAQMLLADLDDSDPNYAILKKVEKQTFRASQIVNSLLEFARNREQELVPVDLAALVDDSLDLLRPRLVKHSVRTGWQRPEGEILVPGNEGELQQVLTNLVINASDAFNGQGGNLSLTLEPRGERVLLTVEDDGPGIPPAQLARIFEPFFTTKVGRGGTGLGLAISYEIIQRHGGDLKAASVAGQGSRFTIELPVLRDLPETA
ncbi:MAG: ATP-binding protein [Acidobacteriota bacterium]